MATFKPRGFRLAVIDTKSYVEDECRASITAAKNAPGLTAEEKRDLIMDAVFRARENGQVLEMDEKMKEVVYGYSSSERGNLPESIDSGETSEVGTETDWEGNDEMSEMWDYFKDYDDAEK